MLPVLTALLLFSTPALAKSDSDDAPPDNAVAAQDAEYVRLSQEMEKLAQRNAWTGVERSYRKMMARGAQPSFDDLKRGAHAAQSLGDITATRSRLLQAHELREDKEVIDWLGDIDGHFGEVFLAGDLGKVALSAKLMPFNPVHARSVQYAIDQVADTGVYGGYLPEGAYVFSERAIEVQPRVQSVRMDLRTEEGIKDAKKAEKQKKKAKKKSERSR